MRSSPTSNEVTDVLIIGAGPAGLSCATVLPRLLWKTVIFDSGVCRYQESRNLHMVPGWDHQDPISYQLSIKKDLTARYQTNQFVDAWATTAEQIKSGQHTGLFRVTDSDQNEWLGKKLVLATGSVEQFPDVPGYEDCWIKGM
ncbi:hypothetical protein B0O99DRAFT_646726 [Bisporella sp. PMI_857]|nr:hypothetical protein B0O99DRAFT_646726 [Bisporella sp. PMI_857]